MSRKEFSKEVRRAAIKRADGRCEAVGKAYGLEPNTRCGASIAYGFHIDHIVPDGLGGDASLENAACVCKACHKVKTERQDTSQIAKMKRQRDKHMGIRAPKKPWPKRRFNEHHTSNVRQIDQE